MSMWAHVSHDILRTADLNHDIMSCACENRKNAGDLDRIRRIAKKFAQMEQTTVAIIRNNDGTYGFSAVTEKKANPIIEYISEY